MIDLPTTLLRLGLAILYGAAIGIERQWRHKNAGIKTNTLVALGAAGFAMMSNTFGPGNHNPAQLAAAVVSGIGFIGAGVIIHRGATVQGVTTAATLWATASVGVAVGLGQHIVGASLCGTIVIVQFALRKVGLVLTKLERNRNEDMRMELRVDCRRESVRDLNELWRAYADNATLTQIRRGTHHGMEKTTWRVVFVAPASPPLDIARLEEKLVTVAGVTDVEVRNLGVEETVA